jgi:uncharacterized protein YpuA (DUF1002 family)
MKKSVGLEFFFSANRDIERQMADMESHLKAGSLYTNRIHTGRKQLGNLMSKASKMGKDHRTITNIDYPDAQFVGDFKDVKHDLINLEKLFSGNSLLKFNDNIYHLANTEMKSLVEGNSLSDGEEKLNDVMRKSGWKDYDGYFEHTLTINDGAYYIGCSTENGYPQFSGEFNDDIARRWVRQVDNDLTVILTPNDIHDAITHGLKLLEALEHFDSRFNQNAKQFEKLVNVYKLSTKELKGKEKDVGGVLTWVNTSFTMRNLFEQQTIAFITSVITYLEKAFK